MSKLNIHIIHELKTKRLIMRQWKQSDFEKFAKLNADEEVMEFFPKTLTASESNILANKILNTIKENGWGLWAVESIEDNNFIGFVGLHSPSYNFSFCPCVEIGWRLSKKYWRKGYANEAANRALKFAFKVLNLEEVVSFTAVSNYKSRALMEKLNLINTNQNFMHPNIPANNTLREHVLYKISKSQWFNTSI